MKIKASTERTDIGARIRALREAKGWSQADMGRHMGVTQQQAAKLESPRSNPKVGTLRSLVALFGVPLSITTTVTVWPEEQRPRNAARR